MNRHMLSALIGKDVKLYFSNRFFALVTVLSLVAFTLLYFLLPNAVDETLALGLYMADMPPALAERLDNDEITFLRAPSTEALRQAVLEGEVPAGYAFPDDLLAQLRGGGRPVVELYLSPDVPAEFRDIYQVVLEELSFLISGQTLAIETTEIVLGRDLAGAQIPLRQKMLPLLAVFVLMVECLGLASLIAAEVESGTLAALLVTPLTMPGLFTAKGIFGTLFAFAQAAVLMLITGGLAQQPLLILTALLLGAALVTGVAFLIASVGRDLMSVMGWGILALLLLGLPTFTVLIPGLATDWIKLIPSFFLVETVYEVSNFNAGWADMARNLLLLAAWAAALLALGVVVLRRKFR